LYFRLPEGSRPARGGVEYGKEAADLRSKDMFRVTEVQLSSVTARVWSQDWTFIVSTLPGY